MIPIDNSASLDFSLDVLLCALSRPEKIDFLYRACVTQSIRAHLSSPAQVVWGWGDAHAGPSMSLIKTHARAVKRFERLS